jgi:hypothetical protein
VLLILPEGHVSFVPPEYWSPDGIRRFRNSTDHPDESEETWKSIVRRLKGFCDIAFRRRRSLSGRVSRFGSKVMSACPEIVRECREEKLPLLYRGITMVFVHRICTRNATTRRTQSPLFGQQKTAALVDMLRCHGTVRKAERWTQVFIILFSR